MQLRIRGTGTVIVAAVRYRNMGIEDDWWAWVLELPAEVDQFVPVMPPAAAYEIVEASPEECDHLKAGGYFGLFA